MEPNVLHQGFPKKRRWMVLGLLVSFSYLLGTSNALRIKSIHCSSSSVVGNSATVAELCGEASVNLQLPRAKNAKNTLSVLLSSLGPTIGLNQLEGIEPHIKKIYTETIPEDYDVSKPYPLTPTQAVAFPPYCGPFFLIAVLVSETEEQTIRSSDYENLMKPCKGGKLNNLTFEYTADGFSAESFFLTQDGIIETKDISVKVVNKGEESIASRTVLSAPSIKAYITDANFWLLDDMPMGDFDFANSSIKEFSQRASTLMQEGKRRHYAIYKLPLKGLETTFIKEDGSGSIEMGAGFEKEVMFSKLQLATSNNMYSRYFILALYISDGKEMFEELYLPLSYGRQMRDQTKKCIVAPHYEDSNNAAIFSLSGEYYSSYVTFYDGYSGGFKGEHMDTNEYNELLLSVLAAKEKVMLLQKFNLCPEPPLEDGESGELLKNSLFKDLKELVAELLEGAEDIEVEGDIDLGKTITTKFFILAEKILEEILNPNGNKAREFLLPILVSAIRNMNLISETVATMQNMGVTNDITEFLMGADLSPSCGWHGPYFGQNGFGHDFNIPMWAVGQYPTWHGSGDGPLPGLFPGTGSGDGPLPGLFPEGGSGDKILFPEIGSVRGADIGIQFPDEKPCKYGPGKCFPCINGTFINIDWVCDKIKDCEGGDDEKDCDNMIKKRSIPEKELHKFADKREKKSHKRIKKSSVKSKISKRSTSVGNSVENDNSLNSFGGISFGNSLEGIDSLESSIEGRAEAGIGSSPFLPGNQGTGLSGITAFQEMIRELLIQRFAQFMARLTDSPFQRRRNSNFGPNGQSPDTTAGENTDVNVGDLSTVNPFMAYVVNNIQTAVREVTDFQKDDEDQRWRPNFSSPRRPSSTDQKNWQSPPPHHRPVPKMEQDSLRLLLQLYIRITSSSDISTEKLSEYGFISMELRQAFIDFIRTVFTDNQNDLELFEKAWTNFMPRMEFNEIRKHLMGATFSANGMSQKKLMLSNVLKFLQTKVEKEIPVPANEPNMKEALNFIGDMTKVFMSVLNSSSMEIVMQKANQVLFDGREQKLLFNFPGMEPTLKNYCDQTLRSYISATQSKTKEEESPTMGEETKNPYMELVMGLNKKQPKPVYWTQFDGGIYRGERSKLLGITFWDKIAACDCKNQADDWKDSFLNMARRKEIQKADKPGMNAGSKRFLRKGNSQNSFVLGQDPRQHRNPNDFENPREKPQEETGSNGGFGLPSVTEGNFGFGLPPIRPATETTDVNRDLFEAILFPEIRPSTNTLQSRTQRINLQGNNARNTGSTEPRMITRLAGETRMPRGTRTIVGGLVVVEYQESGIKRRSFGSVCNDGWNDTEANVVCMSVAERYKAKLIQSLTLEAMVDYIAIWKTVGELQYIPKFMLSDVQCPENASDFSQCDSAGWGNGGDCYAYNWAGVKCVLEGGNMPT